MKKFIAKYIEEDYARPYVLFAQVKDKDGKVLFLQEVKRSAYKGVLTRYVENWFKKNKESCVIKRQ